MQKRIKISIGIVAIIIVSVFGAYYYDQARFESAIPFLNLAGVHTNGGNYGPVMGFNYSVMGIKLIISFTLSYENPTDYAMKLNLKKVNFTGVVATGDPNTPTMEVAFVFEDFKAVTIHPGLNTITIMAERYIDVDDFNWTVQSLGKGVNETWVRWEGTAFSYWFGDFTWTYIGQIKPIVWTPPTDYEPYK